MQVSLSAQTINQKIYKPSAKYNSKNLVIAANSKISKIQKFQNFKTSEIY